MDNFKIVSKEKRVILFIELVKGCQNTDCPSWGTVCTENDQKFMTTETLEKVLLEVATSFENSPFSRIDIWPYGCGDTLDHPELYQMLCMIRDGLGKFGKISLAIDSRRPLTTIEKGDWWVFLDKVKLIHKMPENYDWFYKAREWKKALPIPMSHKFVTDHLTKNLWSTWKENKELLGELKAVSFHTIIIGSDNPSLGKRNPIRVEEGVPFEEGPYPGMPVCRTMIRWDGSPRRCLIAPTKHKTITDLLKGEDDFCKNCFPLTGTGLARFQEDKIYMTPSATCVSDGYFAPVDPY